MALYISFTLSDDYGRTTTRRFGSTRTLLADAISDADAFCTLLAAIADIGIDKYMVESTTVKSVAAQTGANVDVGATITSTLENGVKHAIHVPAIKSTLIGAGGVIDVEDEDVVAFMAQFLTGGKFRVSEGNYVTAVEYGWLDK